MAQKIVLKRSAQAGRVPTTASLDLGEVAINTTDGKAYIKRSDETIQTLITTNSTTTGSLTLIGDIEQSGSQYISGSIQDVHWIDFDSSGSVDKTWKPGRLFYDNEQGALTFYNNEAEISLQLGQEFYVRVYNDSGQPIENGTPVYISGSQGDVPYIWPAVADFHVDNGFDNHIIGLATHRIEDKSVGYVTEQGVVRGIDTNAFSAGDILYVSASAGKLTNIPPEPPLDKIQVGFVIRKANNGIIFVKPEEPIHFHDISGLSGSNPVEGEVWVYDDIKKVWTNSDTLPNIIASGSFSGSFEGSLDNINDARLDGNLVVSGSTILGDTSSDIIVTNAQFSSSLIPSNTDVFDLGTPTNKWKDFYVERIFADVQDVGGGIVVDSIIAENISPQQVTFIAGDTKLTGSVDFTYDGTILFVSGSGSFSENLNVGKNLIVDTDTLYVDSTNNRVSIGTTTSFDTFKVQSTNLSTTVFVNTQNANADPANYTEIALGDVGARRTYWRTYRDNSGKVEFAYNNDLRFLSDADGTPTEQARFTVDGNFLLNTTTDNGATAQIDGDLTVSGPVTLSSTLDITKFDVDTSFNVMNENFIKQGESVSNLKYRGWYGFYSHNKPLVGNTQINYWNEIIDEFNNGGGYTAASYIQALKNAIAQNPTYNFLPQIPYLNITVDFLPTLESWWSEIVPEFENEPRIIGWYLFDEPEYWGTSTFPNRPTLSATEAKSLYDSLKALTAKDVYCVFADVDLFKSTYADQPKFWDVFMFDVYPYFREDLISGTSRPAGSENEAIYVENRFLSWSVDYINSGSGEDRVMYVGQGTGQEPFTDPDTGVEFSPFNPSQRTMTDAEHSYVEDIVIENFGTKLEGYFLWSYRYTNDIQRERGDRSLSRMYAKMTSGSYSDESGYFFSGKHGNSYIEFDKEVVTIYSSSISNSSLSNPILSNATASTDFLVNGNVDIGLSLDVGGGITAGGMIKTTSDISGSQNLYIDGIANVDGNTNVGGNLVVEGGIEFGNGTSANGDDQHIFANFNSSTDGKMYMAPYSNGVANFSSEFGYSWTNDRWYTAGNYYVAGNLIVEGTITGVSQTAPSGSLTINGTVNEIEITGTPTQDFSTTPEYTIGLPNDVSVTNSLSASVFYSETSNYLSSDPVIALKSLTHQSKPWITWYDADGNRIAGIAAHSQSIGGTDHKHISIETADTNGSLQTRFEILYGLDQTKIQTKNADFEIGAGNPLIVGSSAGLDSDVDFYNGHFYKHGTGNIGFGDKDWALSGLQNPAKWEFYRATSTATLMVHNDDGLSDAEVHLRSGTRDYVLTNDGVDFQIEAEGVNVFTLTSDGDLSIDRDMTIGRDMTVVGNLLANSITETSSKRYKENVKDIGKVLDTVNKLRPVSFDWKKDKRHDYGFIAEEVNEIIPELVKKDINGNIEGINYSKLTSFLIGAIKELTEEVSTLKQKIDNFDK